jgi:sugar phosphate isomerase/epimerase
MIKFDRREFLRYASATAVTACASAVSLHSVASPMGWPLGFQGYDVRFLIIKDWDSGWTTMRTMGYQSVDMVSFKGYGYENSPLASMPAKEIADKLDAVGMQRENCQFYFSELHNEFDAKMEFSHTLRIKYVICAPSPDHMQTIDDWKWQADQLNALGERVKKAGFQLGYHNHEVEFVDIAGVTPYDVLVERCVPSLVGFQIDVGNLTFGGKDAIHYLNKYPDRYFSMHAKDYRPGKTSVPVGKGILDWPVIFNIVKEKTKIRTYYAEVAAYAIGSLHGIPATAWPGDSIDELRESAEYLKSLNV